MSIGSLLSVARGGMIAQQKIIQTAGHNIANVETEGYTRQRVELTPATAERFSYGSVGTGVRMINVAQIREPMLDAAYRKESTNASSSSMRQDLLGQVEGILGEPSETGLASAMDAFWGSWSDLASQPTSSAARSVVQQRGNHVASLLNGFDTRLTDLANQTKTALNATVDEINTLARDVAQLNGQIVSSEVNGTTAGDLRDQRNIAIDKLSKLADTRVIQNADGSVMVHLGNNTLVDGVHTRPIETIVTKTGDVALKMQSGTEPMLPMGGKAQVMLEFLNKDIPEVRGQLDALASGLVSSVNALHAGGELYPAGGPPVAAGNFFDATKVTARDIALDAGVAASATKIAAGAAAGVNAAGPGNNEVALGMAGLRAAAAQVTYTDGAGQTRTGSFTAFYQEINSRLGTQVSAAKSDTEIHSTLASQADTRRQSVAGVNLDEELTTLMRAQQAYAAAAKVISTASEMMDTLVHMV